MVAITPYVLIYNGSKYILNGKVKYKDYRRKLYDVCTCADYLWKKKYTPKAS